MVIRVLPLTVMATKGIDVREDEQRERAHRERNCGVGGPVVGTIELGPASNAAHAGGACERIQTMCKVAGMTDDDGGHARMVTL